MNGASPGSPLFLLLPVVIFVLLVLLFVVLLVLLFVVLFVLFFVVLLLLVRLGRCLRRRGSGAWLAFMLRGDPFPTLIAFRRLRGFPGFRRVARGTAAFPSIPIVRFFRAL